MDPEKWQKVKSVFNDVIELEPGRREDFLASNTAGNEILEEVRRMLGADDESLIVHSPFSKLAEISENGNKPPEKIGNYKILRELGRGGMGVVYEAVRDDGEFSQKAAIKIIKRGMDSDDILRRFRNERQILAELQHPNIARLFDGGVTQDGSPYYVMEYIEGEPLDVYCREKNCGIGEKLDLFRQICAAVSYAHSQLVVHRDLKPSNMFITNGGDVKLLDFGIAKVLDIDGQDSQGTATQLGMMTPAYASPEQVRGEKVTTSSDLYSLGIVFYELITGERPYRTEGKTHAEMIELVCRSGVRKPSETARASGTESADGPTRLPAKNRLLKGDLDNIALKALQKDPARRYSSVEQFSGDIRRHLIGRPVSARPDTVSYRFKKFVGRNRVSALAAVLIFISLCTGITVAVWQARRAQREQALAENRFAEVRELANSVIFKYHDAIAALPGSTAAREMLVRDATKYLDNLAKESEADPELQRELALAYIKLGDVLGKAYAANVGDTAGATESYQKAVALLEKAVSSEPASNAARFDLVKAYEALFGIYMRNSNKEKPEVLEKALKLQEELLIAEPDNPDYKLEKANLLLLSGDNTGLVKEKLPFYDRALPLGEELYAGDPRNQEKIRFLMRINQRIGTTCDWLAEEEREKNGDAAAAKALYARALPFYERSLEMARTLFEIDPQNAPYKRNYAMGGANLAEIYAKNGKRAESLAMMERSMSILREVEKEDPNNKEIRSDISYAHESVANSYQSLGETDNAIRELEKAIIIQESIWRKDGFNDELMSATLRNHNKIIKIYAQAGDEKRAGARRSILQEIRAEIEKVRNHTRGD
jgi:serine/threonine protein kinase